MKKLYRSKTNKTLTGLLGGVAEYFKIDPVIVRLLFIFLLIISHVWPMLVVYAIGYFVVPLPPEEEKDEKKK